MDKLQKIGNWIWYNKERMILVVMVLVLAYRVYEVLNPPPPRQWPPLASPRTQLPDDEESRQMLGLPGSPPPRPGIALPGDYVSFFDNNPFWYHSGTARQDTGADTRGADLNIQLLDVQVVRGTPRARLSTPGGRPAWYDENEQFANQYELQRIDPETGTVVVYSERHRQSFTLRRQ